MIIFWLALSERKAFEMKKITKLLLAIISVTIILVAFSVCASATEAGFENFKYSGIYTAGQFYDVDGTEWFARYVEDAYNFAFFRGKSENLFDPGGLLTVGEAVTLVVRLNSIYQTGSADFKESVPYYTVYADYALSHGIIDHHYNYNATATRALFAELVYNALPPETFSEINTIADYGICDVVPSSSYGTAVYGLYRAGILTGSDRYGTFFPDSSISRAETCAVMVRLADPATRVNTKLPTHINAEVIFKRSSDAVFMLETFDSDGASIRTASGFFISNTGLAVTNLHVFENAASATATLFNGNVYTVRGVNDISTENNLALFSIDANISNLGYLLLADSDLVVAGNSVYALGSPRDLINSITDGIVSNINRIVDESTFIQFTAPISFGSGGSPVLNSLGQVIGVASSSFSYGQNLNLAVPANFIKELKQGKLITLKELLEITTES